MRRETLDRLQELRRGSIPAAIVTRMADGVETLIHEGGGADEMPPGAPGRSAVLDRIRSGDSGVIDGQWFVRVYVSPVRLVLVGAVHIAQALIPVAQALGFQVVIVDPRTAFAAAERFPGAHMLDQWPDRALAELKPDARTAVITLTHDPKLDDPALKTALAGTAFFVGALGSRRTHAARLERLRADGVPEGDLARIRAPVGLSLGGRRPAEIAVAIGAQIVGALHGGLQQ